MQICDWQIWVAASSLAGVPQGSLSSSSNFPIAQHFAAF
jgi:hypothetical protein